METVKGPPAPVTVQSITEDIAEWEDLIRHREAETDRAKAHVAALREQLEGMR